MEPLRKLRSAASLLLALFWFVPAFVLMDLIIVPLGRLLPARRLAMSEWFIRGMARVLLASLRAGGARFDRIGRVPTDRPCLIVGNHQSIVDPAVVIAMALPHVPAFVARSRYALVPVVSSSMRAVGCPVIDPTRDARGAVLALAQAAGRLEHGLIIYPEGHRTQDGEVRPFRSSGMIAILGVRRMPVYLVISDGLWVNRRLADVVFNVHRMRGVIEVLGPFTPPDDAGAIPAFVEEMRDRMIAHLAGMRSRGERAA